jgi:polysaccharide biosynthesis transport protein
MSGQQLQPLSPNANMVLDEPEDFGPPPGAGPSSAAAAAPGIGRYWQAIKRFKWLVLLLTALGTAGGVAATRFVSPSYEVRATVQLDQGGGDSRQGPIQAEALLEASGWQDLLRSYTIADYVVNDLGLFVAPALPQDSALFSGFRVNQTQLRPGSYKLEISGNRYTLRTRDGLEVESGAVADSIGRKVGFAWQPALELLSSRTLVEFNVQTPREASTKLIESLEMVLMEESPFLSLKLTGTDPQRTARTLNAWVEQFVAVATMLKKKRVATMRPGIWLRPKGRWKTSVCGP